MNPYVPKNGHERYRGPVHAEFVEVLYLGITGAWFVREEDGREYLLPDAVFHLIYEAAPVEP